jgi:hypothetical protein
MFFMKGDRQGGVNYYLSWKDTGHITWASKRVGEGFDYLDIPVPTLPQVGEWTHIAIVFDRPTVSLYVNGVKYSYTNVSTAGSMDRDLVVNSEPLWIGAGRDGGATVAANGFSAPFDGRIDELALFDRALTDSDIATILASAAPAATADRFDIDEGSANGTVVGHVAATDPDVGDTLTYSVTGGTGATAFEITAAGEIRVLDSAQLDYETTTSFSLVVEATDSGSPGLTDSMTVTIDLNPVNDNDPVADNESFTVSQGGTATEADLDAGTSLLDGDTDADLPNDALTVDTTPAVAPLHGNVTLNADGTFVYTHNGSANFSDSFSYTLRDADGGVADTGSVTISVSGGANTPPSLTPGPGSPAYTENAARIFIDSAISVTDPDSADLDGGSLIVTLTANGSAEDRLALQNQGTGPNQVGVSGTDVTYNFGAGAVTIGTVSGGTSGSDPLVITFNANSTPAAVEAVARRITFMATGDDPSSATRTVAIVVSDGDGGVSLAASKDITVIAVNDAPNNAYSSDAEQVISATSDGATSVVAVDIDGDGDLDVLTASRTGHTVAWYENDGSATPSLSERVVDVGSGGSLHDGPNHATAADLDGDGDQDILVAYAFGDTVTWYENIGLNSLTFTAHDLPFTVDGAWQVFAEDMDGDTDLDIVTSSVFDGQIRWFENDSMSFTERSVGIEGGARFIQVVDLNADGHPDVVAGSYTADTIHWYQHDGNTDPTFTERLIDGSALGAMQVSVADLNGDGHLDVVAANYADNEVSWYESSGGALPTFTQRLVSDTLVNPHGVQTADLDGDGDIDVLAGSYGDDQLVWFESPISTTTATWT